MPGAELKPYVTYALLGINVFVWLLTQAVGAADSSNESETLLKFGAMFGPNIVEGEYWRLFAAMFLHAGITHLAFNSFGLLIFGMQVERFFGHARFATVYVLAGLAGSAASYIFNTGGVAVGASGAIFGILGALVAFFTTHKDMLGEMGRQSLTGLLLLAAINLVVGISTPGIDNFAHVGGFGAGFALGMGIGPAYRPIISFFNDVRQFSDDNPFSARWWIVPVAVVLLVAATAGGTVTHPLGASIRHLNNAEQLLENREHVLALNEVALAVEGWPSYPKAYFMRGRVLADLGDRDGAVTALSLALRLDLRGDERDEALTLLATLGAQVR
ncbi:MAG: rhomboid family intramembrane serine protease [SAR202 cluster bacterium]|nr:rhomboid family intramembrane serine protease [SAR202 cluster bacterium]MDP6301343.1 rhomboid family intramembrane serine protease [SAR202 cluster bacterium]MDP7104097.1 rhomboid family intramembrane serine protease [SAR202 cluster bacterium]MDP7224149.1 rhomboid family intramembrane serine protease [SAR202 cluster bacterium]MDP7414796.1 rhomboid family intramembrane serine protease [SAR202 cluster bacterium]